MDYHSLCRNENRQLQSRMKTLSPTKKNETVSRQQFIDEYCSASKVTKEWLEQRRDIVSCECGDASCRGWQVISKVVQLILCALLLASCTTDRDAGMVAAREMGLKEYIIFPRGGHYDTAVIFEFQGKKWMYHPSIGSFPVSDEHVKELRDHGFMLPVLAQDKISPLPEGCLPRAIADVRAHGGHVVTSGNNAWREP